MNEQPSFCTRCCIFTGRRSIRGACPSCGSHSSLIPWDQLAPDLKAKAPPLGAMDKQGRGKGGGGHAGGNPDSVAG